MSRCRVFLLCLAGGLGLAGFMTYGIMRTATARPAQASAAGRPPAIRPDYANVVIPPNIAPLNFMVEEPGSRYNVVIRGSRGGEIAIPSAGSRIDIPLGAWRELIRANRGSSIEFTIYVADSDGNWAVFEPFPVTVAPAEIDPYLVYRQIRHVARRFRHMGVYQRNLENYDESTVLDNKGLGGRRGSAVGCVNCHTFRNNRPDSMLIHVRAAQGPNPAPTLVLRDGQIANLDTRIGSQGSAAGVITWHPSGRLLAFSTNQFEVFCRSAGFNVEPIDLDADMALYLLDSRTVVTTPAISRPDRCETFPAWSPDGRYLYYCSGPKLPIELSREIKYDLMRIAYDPQSNTWGPDEMVIPSASTGMSITEPRFSPDGRFLLFCMADYSVMPTYRPTSDLHLMNLETGRYERLDCNSDAPEAWHSWSSNSRWIVFTSKRGDRLYGRPYLSYIDPRGKSHKPFILPQKDPAFYDSFLEHFNLPELITGPLPVTRRELIEAIVSPAEVLRTTRGTGPVTGP